MSPNIWYSLHRIFGWNRPSSGIQVLTMDSEAWPPDKLISCLSYRPRHILEGMITISEPAQRSAIRRHSNSSIGILDRLPLEILQWALDLLDFQSLSRVSRASLLV
ncbi:uncharacterized protein EURHEDRAFT_408618 [Aspergillus ruber CBS 135680]|uniref:F-box domain-containing protein n=1 Tax=Aspergillus ruber (strain CBS 135680) TaxID=1388766 RepID=A0A017SR77_ASPRC|nr:uncharacterized protein EURHEDRAFT_408618 [Aspergillus ruber CBS 135680]EYE99336.1 hypothetical protein EURHEDRAFT_408618 [Aspergillus ruber CBS 135680]